MRDDDVSSRTEYGPSNTPSAVVIVSIIAMFAVPVLLLWTAFQPIPRVPYEVQVELENEELPELPKICSAPARTDRQRERQTTLCPPEVLESLAIGTAVENPEREANSN